MKQSDAERIAALVIAGIKDLLAVQSPRYSEPLTVKDLGDLFDIDRRLVPDLLQTLKGTVTVSSKRQKTYRIPLELMPPKYFRERGSAGPSEQTGTNSPVSKSGN